jgi:hypothetical protein
VAELRVSECPEHAVDVQQGPSDEDEDNADTEGEERNAEAHDRGEP